MSNQVEGTSHRAWVGILLVILGFLFLLETFDIMDFRSVFSNWWPLILIVIGLVKLRGRDKTGGAILLVVGLAFLSATLDIVNWHSIFRFWPLILVLVGISLLLKTRGRTFWGTECAGETSEDFIKASAIFGGINRTVASQNFKGGEVMALFGGVDLDLRHAKSSPQECHLSITALFGGVEVIVPPDWQVSVSGTPILGGIENKTTVPKGEDVGAKVYCQCTVAFGGVEIKN